MTTKQKVQCVWLGAAISVIACGLPLPGAAQQNRVPSYLADYAALYAKEPRAAATQWFRDAELGLFVHYALASVLERGKPEYLELTEEFEEQVNLDQLPASHRAKLGISEEHVAQIRTVHGELMKRFRAERFDADAIVFLLQIARSPDANLLINIGPRADGSIHPHDDRTLREVGRRLREKDFGSPDRSCDDAARSQRFERAGQGLREQEAG